jgi:hypothetical protein
MKKVELKREEGAVKRGVYIETPWLRIEEAAAYCGISRSSFVDRAKNLPYGGDDDCRLYNVSILDKFVNNELTDAPFNKELIGKTRRRSRRVRIPTVGDNAIVHPLNGKIFRPREV